MKATAAKFVAVHVAGKGHVGEVHVADCRDLSNGEYPTQEHTTAAEAKYDLEGNGYRHENGEWVTDFPTVFAPCVKKAVR